MPWQDRIGLENVMLGKHVDWHDAGAMRCEADGPKNLRNEGSDTFVILTTELLVVTRRGPLALLDHLLDSLPDLRSGGNNIVNGELVEGSSVFDVLEGGLQVLELGLDLGGGGLSLLSLMV